MEPKDHGMQLMERDDEAHLLSSDYPSGPHDKQPDGALDESHDYGMRSGSPDEVSPHTGETEQDMMRRHAMERASFAHGGDVGNPKLQQSHLEPDESDSLVQDIMRKRKRYAEGGRVDLEANSEEDRNNEDQMSFKAAGKEQYDLRQLGPQPMDSNESGDSREDDSENINDEDNVSAIRRKMKAKRGE